MSCGGMASSSSKPSKGSNGSYLTRPGDDAAGVAFVEVVLKMEKYHEQQEMEVRFLKWGTPKSSILIGCSITNHPFGGVPPFMETPK